ncbi:hypothetical protein KHC33_15305 [Methanospirillum sp. J.3.6.1-F.2.7.3]|uniref:Uncharacterized protein n=1 Tax=Methanospirillum purgamenti TaxID=2834276 RepID=A0A8E7B1H1_9EURY|nr:MULTISPECIES: hypothetical protein [Methanospirillum]MDX8548980.1 hypothetical protein [Methanospirillum hungatei]QVV88667.1 hypothetical protein KHC33_15305 [Methanospirillum sp. J.3.6.1-F.2.7.3]
MTFTITSVKEKGAVSYEKIGRLIPDGEHEIRVIKDGSGEILRIQKTDFTLLIAGLAPDGLQLSDSGNRVIITAPSGEEYVVLTNQVRGMIEQWPKKKAAVFLLLL